MGMTFSQQLCPGQFAEHRAGLLAEVMRRKYHTDDFTMPCATEGGCVRLQYNDVLVSLL